MRLTEHKGSMKEGAVVLIATISFKTFNIHQQLHVDCAFESIHPFTCHSFLIHVISFLHISRGEKGNCYFTLRRV